MNSSGRTAVAVAAGAVGALAVGWVIVPASADTTPTATASATTAGTGTPAATGKAKARANLLGGRLMHGELTLRTPGGGTELAETQRGEIMAVSPTSITLQSLDGFSVTYVVNAQTVVREKGQPAAIGDLSAHERAMVVGVKVGDTWVAKIIRCVRAAKGSTTS